MRRSDLSVTFILCFDSSRGTRATICDEPAGPGDGVDAGDPTSPSSGSDRVFCAGLFLDCIFATASSRPQDEPRNLTRFY